MKWCSEKLVIIESSFSSMAKLNIIPLIWINETAATLISLVSYHSADSHSFVLYKLAPSCISIIGEEIYNSQGPLHSYVIKDNMFIPNRRLFREVLFHLSEVKKVNRVL